MLLNNKYQYFAVFKKDFAWNLGANDLKHDISLADDAVVIHD